MLELAALLLFPALMAYSAASDLLTMTISNRISLILILGFLVLSVACGLGWREIVVDHLACGGTVLLLTFALFAAGWIGGGDAKLAAATAVWLGWSNLFDYGLDASVLGGGLTLAILFCRKHALPRAVAGLGWVERLHAAESGIPYGIALALAGLLIYPETAVWSAVSAA